MTTIADVSLPATEFPLHETLEITSDVEFEIERMVAHETDRVMPFVWATSETIDRETLTDALADDPSVDDVTELAAYDEEWFAVRSWEGTGGARSRAARTTVSAGHESACEG